MTIKTIYVNQFTSRVSKERWK